MSLPKGSLLCFLALSTTQSRPNVSHLRGADHNACSSLAEQHAESSYILFAMGFFPIISLTSPRAVQGFIESRSWCIWREPCMDCQSSQRYQKGCSP